LISDNSDTDKAAAGCVCSLAVIAAAALTAKYVSLFKSSPSDVSTGLMDLSTITRSMQKYS